MDAKDIERQLEALLNEEEPYIDDAGFTRSMLDRLPPPTRRPEWLKPAVLIFATVLSSILVVVFLPESSVLAAKITEISSMMRMASESGITALVWRPTSMTSAADA